MLFICYTPYMEKSPQSQTETLQKQEVAPKSVESSANFEGNHSMLLFSRVRNPFIQEQLINLLYEEELNHAARGDKTPDYDENGNMIPISNNEIKLKHVDYVARSKKEILEDFYTRLLAVETDTPISYDPNELPRVTTRKEAPIFSYKGISMDPAEALSVTSREIIPKFSDYCISMLGATNASLEKQKVIKSAVEAHEKGHVLRPYFDKFFRDYFRKGFVVPAVETLSLDDLPDKNLERYPEETIEDFTKRHIENHIYYLYSGNEIAERMSQLKGYFGFKGSEKFTKEHLDYARDHYVSDTHLDNSMTEFFNAIAPETEEEFLRLINTTGI